MKAITQKLFTGILVGISVATVAAAASGLKDGKLRPTISLAHNALSTHESSESVGANTGAISVASSERSEDGVEAEESVSHASLGFFTSLFQTALANTSSNSTSTSTANVFTPETLALHNTAGNCYVAYNGTVYDVSNNPSWANCAHHGAHGGIDITTFFPHPVNYFDGLPKVGTYVSGSGTSGVSGSTSTSTPSAGIISRHDDDGDDDDDDGQASLRGHDDNGVHEQEGDDAFGDD